MQVLALVIAREGESQIPTLKALNFHSPGLPRERLPWEDDPQYAVANPEGVALFRIVQGLRPLKTNGLALLGPAALPPAILWQASGLRRDARKHELT